MNTLLSPATVTLSTSEIPFSVRQNEYVGQNGIDIPASVPSGYVRQATLEAIARFSAFKGI